MPTLPKILRPVPDPPYLLHKTLISDAFTDTGISKYNGEPNEKNMKELEPWIGDTEIEVGGLDAEKSVSKHGQMSFVTCDFHQCCILTSVNSY